ncbi:MAG: GNAT family N-acetyltransferase [Candidatus Dormibacteraeota bacterium]|nr:GNAT family N-acetyltransferase [Candidatus Dormibacteraeota bacterium]
MKAGEPAPLVVLRPARADDVIRLMAWRNEGDAVRFSETGRPVSEAEHEAWFTDRLSDPQTRLWIAEADGAAAGQVRLDIADGNATVSIAVERERRGQGLGLAMLNAMIEAVAGDPDIHLLRAFAAPDNVASVVVFERAGFRRAPASDSGFLILLRSADGGRADDAKQ